MEAVDQLITINKRLYLEEDDLKEELIHLKTRLLAEENNLTLVKRGVQEIAQQNALLEQNLEYVDTNTRLIETFRTAAKTSITMHSELETYVRKANPTSEQQSEAISKLKETYAAMLKKYESSPTYLAILEEDTKEQKFIKSINEKQAELSKIKQL